MDNTQIKELIATHGTLKVVEVLTPNGKLMKVYFKEASDDVLELAYSKDNMFTRGKSLYVNCKVGSENDELLTKSALTRQKCYMAALQLDEMGVGVGELKALSLVSEA